MLLAGVPLAGRIVTGDALYCQRALSAQIVAAGGEYLFAVKGNQPTLARDIQLFFDDLPPGVQPGPVRPSWLACMVWQPAQAATPPSWKPSAGEAASRPTMTARSTR